MKFNMGCGNNRMDGFINVDLYPECSPDQVADLEKCPWPWPDNCAESVVFNHSLEHMGANIDAFLNIMKELYRICKNDALVTIAVPHPRHDFFINDPSHVRIVTPEMLGLFSRRNNEHWKKNGVSNTPYAQYLDVDFELVNTVITPDEKYVAHLQAGRMTLEEVIQQSRETNNVISEYRMDLKVIKPA